MPYIYFNSTYKLLLCWNIAQLHIPILANKKKFPTDSIELTRLLRAWKCQSLGDHSYLIRDKGEAVCWDRTRLVQESGAVGPAWGTEGPCWAFVASEKDAPFSQQTSPGLGTQLDSKHRLDLGSSHHAGRALLCNTQTVPPFAAKSCSCWPGHQIPLWGATFSSNRKWHVKFLTYFQQDCYKDQCDKYENTLRMVTSIPTEKNILRSLLLSTTERNVLSTLCVDKTSFPGLSFLIREPNPMYLLEGGEVTLLAPNRPHAVSPDYRLTAVWFFHMVFPNKNPEHPISVLPTCALNSRGIRSWL